MPISLFLHPSVDRHLSCFHLLVLVNSAALILAYKYLFESPSLIPLGIYLSGIARSNSNYMFNFLRNHQTVFTVVAPFYISIRKVWELQFLHILTNMCFFHCFIIIVVVSILVGVQWYLFAVLISIFLMGNVVEDHSCIYWQSLYLLGKCFIQVFMHFNWVVCLFVAEL